MEEGDIKGRNDLVVHHHNYGELVATNTLVAICSPKARVE